MKHNLTSIYLLMVCSSGAWGFQSTCIKWLTNEWNPVTITAVRYLVVGILLLGYRKFMTHRPIVPKKSLWLPLSLMGLTGIALNNIIKSTGIMFTSVTNSTLISATTPVITAFMAFLIMKKEMTRASFLGLFVSFMGGLLIVSHGTWAVIRNINFNYGDVLCFISQWMWAAYSLLGANVLKYMPATWVTGCSAIFGAFATLFFGLLTNQLSVCLLSTKAMFSLLYIVFGSGLFTMISWNLAIKRVGPGIAPVFLNIMPLVGMISGHFLFGEHIGLIQICGAAAICTGVLLTSMSKRI